MRGDPITPAILTRSEMEWLSGAKQVTATYARHMKAMIKTKVETFLNQELPLLESKGFLANAESLERAKYLTGLHHPSPQKFPESPF